MRGSGTALTPSRLFYVRLRLPPSNLRALGEYWRAVLEAVLEGRLGGRLGRPWGHSTTRAVLEAPGTSWKRRGTHRIDV
eukprot:4938923-Pyramimonas_sp.AAC.1